MNKIHTISAVAVFSMISSVALGHGTPVDVSVDGNQLTVPHHLSTGTLNNVAGVLITGELPGFGVTTTANGVPDGTQIYLNIASGLMYWDGSSLMPTSTSFVIEAPTHDAFGNSNVSPVSSYSITALTGVQTGMLWGTYDSDPAGWHTHGTYSLFPNAASAGVYGVGVTIDSPSHDESDVFLLSWEYDPTGSISSSNVALGVAAMQQELVPEPSTFVIGAIGGALMLLIGVRRRSSKS